MKKRIILCAVATVILIGAIAAVWIGLDFKAKTREEEMVQQELAELVEHELVPEMAFPGDLQMLYEAYLDEMEADEKARLVLLRTHSEKVSVEIISAEDGIATMKICGPDLAALMSVIVEEQDFSGVPDAMLQVKQKMAGEIERGNYSSKEWLVSVSYVIKDGELEIEETFDYLDAIYGGLLTLNKESENALQEAMKYGFE